MSLLRRRGKKYKAIRFYDADFHNLVYGKLFKKFHEKSLFFVRQSKKFTWRLSKKINPYKLRKRKRSERASKFLAKQQLKHFLLTYKEYQFRHLYRKILGHKRGHFKKPLLSILVNFFEARLDSFLFKMHFAKPFNLQTVLREKFFILNDANIFLKKNYLVNIGDRYSLKNVFSFKYYIRRNISLKRLWLRKFKRRRFFIFDVRFRRRRRLPFVKKRFFVHKKPNVIKKMKKLIVERRKTLKKVFLRRFVRNIFSLEKKKFKLRKRQLFFKRLRNLIFTYIPNLNFSLLKFIKTFKKRVLFLRLIKLFILRFRKHFLYRYFRRKKWKKWRFTRVLRKIFPFKPWTLFMKWRVGFLLPDPFLRLVFFLEQPNKSQDMLFSFSFDIRNLLFVYQGLK